MVDLTYRDIRADDFAQLHHIASQWDVVRQLGGWPWPADPAFTRSRCKPHSGDGFVWAVCIDNRLYGTIGVTRGEVGYMFDLVVQGQGIATQAARAAISHAFDRGDQNRLNGTTWHDNPASYRVLQKLGFVHWCTRYEHAKARGLPTLVHNHRLTRAAWDRLRSPQQ